MTSTQMTERRDSRTTRKLVLAEARRRFATHPYGDVTLKDIAADAGVSAPLVIKYFGTKEQLFKEAADFRDQFDRMLDAPTEDLGRHLVTTLLAVHQEEGVDPLLALMFMSSKRDAPASVRRALRLQFIDRLAARLSGEDQQLRAEIIAAEIIGVAALRRVVSSQALTSADHDTLVRLLAPRLQALVEGQHSDSQSQRQGGSHGPRR